MLICLLTLLSWVFETNTQLLVPSPGLSFVRSIYTPLPFWFTKLLEILPILKLWHKSNLHHTVNDLPFFDPPRIWPILFTVWNYWLFLIRLQTPQKSHAEALLCTHLHLSWYLDYRLSVTILKKPWDIVLSSGHFNPRAKRSRFPTSGPAVRGVGDTPLTRRPRGFSTFGLREKCMCRLPSSLTVTDTFFKVLFPQCEQNTRLMSDVVLETRKERLWPEPQAASPVPRAQGESQDSGGMTTNRETAEPYCMCHKPRPPGLMGTAWANCGCSSLRAKGNDPSSKYVNVKVVVTLIMNSYWTLWALFYKFIKTILWDWYYLHFTNGDTEAR